MSFLVVLAPVRMALCSHSVCSATSGGSWSSLPSLSHPLTLCFPLGYGELVTLWSEEQREVAHQGSCGGEGGDFRSIEILSILRIVGNVSCQGSLQLLEGHVCHSCRDREGGTSGSRMFPESMCTQEHPPPAEPAWLPGTLPVSPPPPSRNF